MLLFIFILLSTFFLMEGVAWFTHRFIMHGILWVLHKDHHQKTPGSFERNDAFFLIFAIPSWLFIMLGMMEAANWSVALGLGIALYGLCYFLVHDVYIHGRFIPLGKVTIPLLEKVREAHLLHHSNTGKDKGAFFGLLFAPFLLSKEKRNE